MYQELREVRYGELEVQLTDVAMDR